MALSFPHDFSVFFDLTNTMERDMDFCVASFDDNKIAYSSNFGEGYFKSFFCDSVKVEESVLFWF